MPYYQSQGKIPPKRHTQFRNRVGKLYYEELFSTKGFAGPYSLLYHLNQPIELTNVASAGSIEQEEWTCDVQRNHKFSTQHIQSGGDFLTSRRILLFNDDLTISIANPDTVGPSFYRNGLCDELIVVVEGFGDLVTPFGKLSFEAGDMIVIPAGVTLQFIPEAGITKLFIVESTSKIVPPEKYFVQGGQMAEHSPFCERDIRRPILQEPMESRGKYTIVAKFGLNLTSYTLPNHPFDVVGWDGSLYPYAINRRDFEPVTRRIHTMPDEQQAFACAGAMIACFVTRLGDYHPEALPSAPVHSSIDVDEVVFNLGGPNMVWKSASPGLVTLHPRGLLHGPKQFEETIGLKEFDVNAIMVDAYKPLRLTEVAHACDDPQYHEEWRTANG